MDQVTGRLDSARSSYAAGEYEAAELICQEILSEMSNTDEALHLLGMIASRSAKHHAALESFTRAIAAAPENASYHLSAGRTLAKLHRVVYAEAAFREAIRLDPESLEGYSELASVLRRQGRLEEAAAALEDRIRRGTEDAMMHCRFAAALHRSGQFERGWTEYEWRTRMEQYRNNIQGPLWDGSPLEGKTLLILGEQGLGDQIQFIRYASLARQRCARVVVQCDRRVLGLVETCPGVDQVVALEDRDLPHFEAYIWSVSLPRLMGTRLDTVPAAIPYLHADPDRVARWRSVLARFNGDLLVGINWEGNRSNVAGGNRAIPVESFYPLARLDGVRLFSLQKGEGRDQLASVPPDVPLTDLGQHFGTLASTAAAMEALNLVITNDTSLAHLAGALGRPVWLVLPAGPGWRWLDDREDSPWYPTMRIFRQGWTDEGWVQVFGQIERELRRLAAARSARCDHAPVFAACAGGD